MRSSIQPIAESYTTEHRKKRRWLRWVNIMAALVVFCTTYALILPAITWERSLVCEKPEHTHTEDCYEMQTIPGDSSLVCVFPEHVHTDSCYEIARTLICGLEEGEDHTHSDACYAEEMTLVCKEREHQHDDGCYDIGEERTEKVLVCALEEHVHTDACFDAPPSEESDYFCGKIEHQHNENCYFADGTLRCTIPEHTHSEACKCDLEADVETREDWEKTFADVKLTGDWGSDVLAIARTQLGYSESATNFEVQPGGSRNGYTRYGAWYGIPYGDWCAMFCSFCMNYANVPTNRMPHNANCPNWIATLSGSFKLYHESGSDYVPAPGDLIFFDWGGDSTAADHVGFVSEVIRDGKTHRPVKVCTIEGNCSNSVCSNEYSFDDSRILGYGEMPQLLSVETTVEDGAIVMEAACNTTGSYTWQWQVCADGKNWSNISGATALTYTVPADEADKGYSYRISASRRKLLMAASSGSGSSAAPESFVSRAAGLEDAQYSFTTEGGTILIDWDGVDDCEQVTSGASYINVDSAIDKRMSKDCSIDLYDISKSSEAEVPAEGVKVYLPSDEARRVFGYSDGKLEWFDDAEFVTIDGSTYMCFTAYHFSLYGTYDPNPESRFNFPTLTGTTNTSYDKVTGSSSLSNGDRIIIELTRTRDRWLTTTVSNNRLQLSTSRNSAAIWTVESNNGLYLKNQNGEYLTVGNSTGGASGSRNDAATFSYVSGNSCWQIARSGFYLNDYEARGTFAAGWTSGAGSDEGSRWNFYKVTETFIPDRQLAVQKYVPNYTTQIDADTEFTFRLVSNSSNSISSASAATGDYQLYDNTGAQIGTGSLLNGTFKLKAGQTALFTNSDSKYYFVEEAQMDGIETVTATVNNNSAALDTYGSYNYVPATFSDNRSLVKVTNTPVADEESLRITVDVSGTNESFDDSKPFRILVTDENGVPAEYTSYVIGSDEETYSSDDPSITILPGQTVHIFGLRENQSYVIHQYLGDNAAVIVGTDANVAGTDVITTKAGSIDAYDNAPLEVYFPVDYTNTLSVSLVNVLNQETNEDGSTVPPLLNKEPDHHKYIDAFRDGADNPETDLDDKARAGEVSDAEIVDLYRQYLDVGPESAYEAVDVLFVVDYSSSMSGYVDTGFDTKDILGNDAWRCWALDTMLLGQSPSDTIPGKELDYKGSPESDSQRTDGQHDAADNIAQHQRGGVYDNGLIRRIAELNPDNRVAIEIFHKTAAVTLDWTNASEVEPSSFDFKLNDHGTNYSAGLRLATDLMDEMDDAHKKVVVFISDGLPTYYYDGLHEGTTINGSGTEDTDAYDHTSPIIDDFREEVAPLVAADNLDIYTVGIGLGKNNNGAGLNARALLNALSTDGATIESQDFLQILQILDMKITGGYGHYTDLKVTDTLSEYVDFYQNDLDLLIEKIPVAEDGTVETLYVNGALTTDGRKYIKENGVSVDYDTKTVTVDFIDDYMEEGGFTYRISFNIKTKQHAYDEYVDNYAEGIDGYDGVKGQGSSENKKTDYAGNSNYTSSGLPGFHSNQRAVLEYTQARMEEEGVTRRTEYPHPVVQVATTELTITKNWSDGASLHSGEEVVVDVYTKALPDTYSASDPLPAPDPDNDKNIATVTLSAANSWSATLEDLPRGYYYYIVERDSDALADYTASYDPSVVAVPHSDTDAMSFAITLTNAKNKFYVVLKKTDMAGDPLTGAKFKLYTDADLTQQYGETYETNANGRIELGELDQRTYWLVETEAPPGYNRMEGAQAFSVTAGGLRDEEQKEFLPTHPYYSVTVDDTGEMTIYQLNIRNYTGYVLPESGGIGTLPLYTLGLLLCAAALMCGFSMRRKRERRSAR